MTGCAYDLPPPPSPLTLTWVEDASQPISPAPTLNLALSSPISDTSIDFNFSPAVAASYTVLLNSTRDTITLSFLDMLDGNTTYSFTLKSALHSTAGATLDPAEDTIAFTTAAREQEPNGTFALADSLGEAPLYGMISGAADTDVYLISSALGGRLCLAYFDACDTLRLFDSLGRSVAAPVSAPSGDTITVPASAGFPVFAKVFSCVNGSTGMYRLQLIP
jgi:hypothetical protein